MLFLWKRKELESCEERKKEKCGEDGWGWRTRNKIWRGGWYFGCDGNISRLFSSFPSCTLYLSLTLRSSPRPAPESVWGAGLARSPGGPVQRVGLFFYTMSYLGVSGFALAGTTAVNGHHYSFTTAGTDWNWVCTDRPEEPLQLLVLLLNVIKMCLIKLEYSYLIYIIDLYT